MEGDHGQHRLSLSSIPHRRRVLGDLYDLLDGRPPPATLKSSRWECVRSSFWGTPGFVAEEELSIQSGNSEQK